MFLITRIKQALWLHRRFLSVFWINHFLTDSHDASNHSEETSGGYHSLDSFEENELCLLRSCLTIVDNDFEDFQSQATHSASYILWLKKVCGISSVVLYFSAVAWLDCFLIY